VLKVEPHRAVAMSLAVVGATSLVGAALHRRRGTVAFSTGALFATAGIPSAYAGSRLTRLVSPPVLLLLFAGLMLVVAAAILWRRDSGQPGSPSIPKAVAAGAGVGFLTGFLGVGGGFLIVPALVMFGGLSMRDAIGTSLLVIAVNCAAGLAGHLGEEAPDPSLTVLVSVVAAAGVLAGTRLSHRAPPARLRVVFALFVVGVALFLFVRNYNAWIR
jgi:uncharacterized membrane protein YfcA